MHSLNFLVGQENINKYIVKGVVFAYTYINNTPPASGTLRYDALEANYNNISAEISQKMVG